MSTTSKTKLLSRTKTNKKKRDSYSPSLQTSKSQSKSQLKHRCRKIISTTHKFCSFKIIEIIHVRRHKVTLARLLFWLLCLTIFILAIINVSTDIDIEEMLFGIHSGLFTGMFYAMTIILSLRYPFYMKLGIFQIGFDRQMVYHKLCAWMAIISCITHIQDWNWDVDTWEAQTGWYCYGFSILIVAFSFAIFRRKCYKIFVYSHWIFIAGFVVFGWLHNAILVKVGTFLVGLDVLLRWLDNTLRSVEIKNIKLLDYNRVVKIEFTKKYFSYEAGQYVFVRFASLGLLEFHPFSISSHPNEDKITLYIKKIGGVGRWVDKLIEWVQKNDDGTKDWFRNVRLHVEGPHGYLTLKKPVTEYEHVIFIGGGIGITPLDSLFNQLIVDLMNYDCDTSNQIINTREIEFVFSTRSRALITEFATRNKAWHAAKPSRSFTFSYTMVPPLGQIKKSVSNGSGSNSNTLLLKEEDFVVKENAEKIKFSRKREQKEDVSSHGTSHTHTTDYAMTRDMTNIAVETLNIRNSTHITRVKDKTLRKQYQTAYPFIHFERPNVHQILSAAVQKTPTVENICVICSGPMSLMNDCKKWSDTFGTDFHHEIFLW